MYMNTRLVSWIALRFAHVVCAVGLRAPTHCTCMYLYMYILSLMNCKKWKECSYMPGIADVTLFTMTCADWIEWNVTIQNLMYEYRIASYGSDRYVRILDSLVRKPRHIIVFMSEITSYDVIVTYQRTII